MEREILFRGKLSHSGVWVEGNLIKDRNGNKSIIPFNVFEPDGHHLIIDSDEAWRVDPETVGQFTGITDKNRLNIFEGDIIVRNIFGWIRKYKCKWSTCYERFQFVGIDTVVSIYVEDITDILKTYKTGIEIVGNIHDNPELL